MKRTVSLIVVLAYAACGLFAQDSGPQVGTTIKTTTRLVVLNIVVTDKSGRPVTNLKKEDFSVFENGRPQFINTFEAASTNSTTTDPTASVPGGANPTNTSPDRIARAAQPRVILVLDELNSISEDTMFAVQKLQKYLQSQPVVLKQPTSLYVLNKRRLEPISAPTLDRDALLAKIKKDIIELPPHNLESGGIQGAANRLVTSLMALDEITLANAAQKGRKNVIWIGNAMTVLSDTHVSGVDSTKFRNWVHYTANWLEETQTTVYTIDPRGVEVSPAAVTTGGMIRGLVPAGGIVGPDITTGELVFEAVAPESGGVILRKRNDIDVAISDVVADGSSYYTLSYYPTNTLWDGSFRQIKIQLEPANLIARTQHGYYAYPDGFQEQGDQIEFGLSRAVMTPVAFQSIRLSARGRVVPASMKPQQQQAAKSFRSGAKIASSELPAARVEVTIERDELAWTQQPNGNEHTEFVLVTSSIGTSGQVLDNQIHRLEFSQTKEIYDEVPPEPVKLFVFADLPPKTDHVRLVIRDSSTGRLGTYDLPVTALAR